MYPCIDIVQLPAHEGMTIELRGWVYNVRRKGQLIFLILRDGTGFCQCLVSRNDVPPEVFSRARSARQETSIIIRGKVRADNRAPGGYELQVESLEELGPAEGYPIQPKAHGIEFLLDHRHLWLRSRRPFAVLRIRHQVIRAIEDFFDHHGFIRLDAPILTSAACEGTSTLFPVAYFEREAYLSQSGQLYAEAGAMAFKKVYTFGPTFRAEKSKTRRHLTEFWMIEPEVAFIDIDGLMTLAEDLIMAIIDRVLDKCRHELDILERDPAPLEAVSRPFPRLSYDDAVKWLNANGFPTTSDTDFGSPEETALAAAHPSPLIVHRYPKSIKAFYMEPDPENPDRVLCLDVLAPEGYGEIIGGSMRIWDVELLRRRLADYGLDEAAFQWYLDLRRYGSVPHGGFGLGLERTVSWVCGIQHVREAIPFPRTIYRLEP